MYNKSPMVIEFECPECASSIKLVGAGISVRENTPRSFLLGLTRDGVRMVCGHCNTIFIMGVYTLTTPDTMRLTA